MMGIQRNYILILFSALLLCFLIESIAAEDFTTPAANSEEENDSSSEETVEDSNESRRKRSIDSPEADNDKSPVIVDGASGGRAIPGLPDPATILRIAEILQTVGERVIPILVEGNPAERIGSNLQFLRKFRTEIETFTEEMKVK